MKTLKLSKVYIKKSRQSFKMQSKSLAMLQISRTPNCTSRKRSTSMAWSLWNMLTQALYKIWSSTRVGTTTKKTWTTSSSTSTIHASSRRISSRSSNCHNSDEMRWDTARSWTSWTRFRIKRPRQSEKNLNKGSRSSVWSSAPRLPKMMLVAPSAVLETMRMTTRSCFA